MRMAEKRAFQDLSVEATRIGSIIMVTEERQKREKGVTPIPAESRRRMAALQLHEFLFN